MSKSLKFIALTIALITFSPWAANARPLPDVSLTLDKKFYTRSDNFTVSGTVINTEKPSGRVRLGVSIMPALDRGAPLFGPIDGEQDPLWKKEERRDSMLGLTKLSWTQSIGDLRLGEGVYPIDFALALPDHQTIVDRSFLVVIDPNPRRLRTAVLWSLYPGEHRLPDGRLTGPHPLSLAGNNIGLLSKHLDMIEKNPKLKINLAAGPALTEQLTNIVDGFEWVGPKKILESGPESSAAIDAKTWLDHLGRLSKSDRVELLSAPYGQASLAVLNSAGWRADSREQIEHGSRPEADRNGGGFYLPDLIADQDAARDILAAGFTYTVAVNTKRKDFAPRSENVTRVGGKGKSLAVFDADSEISNWLVRAAAVDADVELTAMLAQRFLLNSDKHVAVLTPRLDEIPAPPLVEKAYQTLSELPWIETVRLSTQTENPGEAAVFSKGPWPNIVDPAYKAKLKKLRRLYLNFTGAIPENSRLGRRLTDLFLRAESIRFMVKGGQSSEFGERYIDSATKTINQELAKIQLAPPKKIAFSSPKGKVPIAIFNGTGYPIKSRIEFSGKDFSFPDEVRKEIVLRPKENLVSYDILAGFNGLNILDVRLTVGKLSIANQNVEITVSSILRYLVIGGTILLVSGLGLMFFLKGRKR